MAIAPGLTLTLMRALGYGKGDKRRGKGKAKLGEDRKEEMAPKAGRVCRVKCVCPLDIVGWLYAPGWFVVIFELFFN